MGYLYRRRDRQASDVAIAKKFTMHVKDLLRVAAGAQLVASTAGAGVYDSTYSMMLSETLPGEGLPWII